ncbi:MFS transporter [Cohnella sp. CFH 77786]|uniref:MFS transporter n=1 Tax=Cohnella sp. CFH 77786 TaxID=2662265 RepID=UPI001C60942B|nr:MFS transporter [Cohnella sp. CFH 77786]MBW5447369.1 MFS transporter [Cohnella sp. CFH 77786]
MSAVRQARIWTNARFLALWAGSCLTHLAFSVYLLTESWYVVQELDRENWLGIVMMTTTIPRVLLMAAGGVLADRLKRSSLLFILNVSRAVMIGGMVGLLAAHSLNLGFLLVFALVFGVMDAFFWPANRSLMPSIVPKEQLVRANSVMETTNQLSFFIGPALAGVLLRFGSFEAAFGIAGVFLLAAGFILRSIKEDKVRPAERKPKFSQELKEGIEYVRSSPIMLALMGTYIIINLFFAGPVTAGMPVLVKTSLSGDVMALSYLESAFAIGMMAGGALTGILNLKRKRAALALGLISLAGIGSALLSLIQAVWQGALLMLIIGIFVACNNILIAAFTQESVKPELMGRVQSLLSVASMGFVPVSYALVSVLLSAGVPVASLILSASILLVLFIGLILSTVRIIWNTD